MGMGREQAVAGAAMSADGLLIRYEVQGKGAPALVFVHGWCCDRSYWRLQFEEFAAHYTTVALDLGGHGASGQDRAGWTMGAFGEDVAAVVAKLGLAQVILVGHSMGGRVVVEAARRLSGQVIGIVAVDTFDDLEGTRTQAEIEKRLAPFRADFVQATDRFVREGMFIPASDATLIETIATEMAATPPQVGIGALEEFYRHDAELRAGLQAVQVPVAMINSDFEPTDLAAAERFGISVKFMSGVGHFVMLEDPTTFNNLLEAAVQSILARAEP